MATSPTSFSRIATKIKNSLDQVTIEPIFFFNFLAMPFLHVCQHAVLYKSICLQNYATESDPEICGRLHQVPDLEDKVQKDASIWSMFLSLSYLLPAIASDVFLGAWSDRNGRKVSIMIGFVGVIMTSVAFNALATFPFTPLYLLVLTNIAAGMTGYVAIVMISSNAYLADVVLNKDSLTFRMTICQIFKAGADVIGSFGTSFVLQRFNLAVAVLLAQCFFTCGFLYTLIRLHQMPPATLRQLSMLQKQKRNSQSGASAQGPPSDKVRKEGVIVSVKSAHEKQPRSPEVQERVEEGRGCCEEFIHTWLFVTQLYKEVWQTLSKRRKRHKRTHIFICTLVFFCIILSEVGLQSGPIMSLYVFHRPFYWTASDLGTYRGVQSVFSLMGTVTGALMHRRLHLHDTTIMLLSLASGVIHMILVGLSQWSWMLYLACATGCFHSLLFPAVKAFLVRLVERDEVGKTFAATGIAADLAFVFSTLTFTNVYRATVTVYAGSVFIVAGSIVAFCFGAVLWLRIDYMRQTRRLSSITAPTKKSTMIKPPAFSLTAIRHLPSDSNGSTANMDHEFSVKI